MPPKAHADLGASSAHRWMNCPGSVEMSADRPDVGTEYKREGTAAHDLLERALTKRLDANTWLDTEIPVTDPDGITYHVLVTEEMCEAVQVMIDQVLRLIDHPTTQLFIEQKFDLTPLNPPGPMYGTADVAIWAPHHKHLAVVDYKHGAGVAVDATENEQMLYYLLGAVIALNVKPETLSCTIVQPRAHHPDGIIRTYTLNFETLKHFKKELFAAGAKTLEPNAPLVVGEWCKFCKALAVCPAQHAKAVEVAQTTFDSVDRPAFPTPETLTTEKLALVLAAKPGLVEWLRSVEQYVLNQLDRGVEVPGWKRVAKRANRKWVDPEGAAAALIQIGLPEDELYKKKLVSPAQAEVALKPLGVKLGTLGDGAEVSQESSGYNLVQDSDARPALLPSVSTVFDDGLTTDKPKTPRKTKKEKKNG